MGLHTITVCALAMSIVGAASEAEAAVFSFQGSATAASSTMPSVACAPLLFFGKVGGGIGGIPGVGTSNLGDFSYSHEACTGGTVLPPFHGDFTLDFTDAKLIGTFAGMSTQNALDPLIFDQTSTYTISGGTGRFTGASGTFTNVGFVNIHSPPAVLTFNFDGLINAPAVPEPVSWAMMIGGLGVIGAGLRAPGRRRAARSLRMA